MLSFDLLLIVILFPFILLDVVSSFFLVHGKAGDKDKRSCKIREEKGRTGEVSSLDKMPEIAYFFCSERTGETCEAFSPEGS